MLLNVERGQSDEVVDVVGHDLGDFFAGLQCTAPVSQAGLRRSLHFQRRDESWIESEGLIDFGLGSGVIAAAVVDASEEQPGGDQVRTGLQRLAERYHRLVVLPLPGQHLAHQEMALGRHNSL